MGSAHPALIEDEACSQFFSPPSFFVLVWLGENPFLCPVTAATWKFSLWLARRPTTPWRRTPCGRWMQTSPGCKSTNPTGSSLATLSTQSTRFPGLSRASCLGNMVAQSAAGRETTMDFPGKNGCELVPVQRTSLSTRDQSTGVTLTLQTTGMAPGPL